MEKEYIAVTYGGFALFRFYAANTTQARMLMQSLRKHSESISHVRIRRHDETAYAEDGIIQLREMEKVNETR
jgi:hypothetical protein